MGIDGVSTLSRQQGSHDGIDEADHGKYHHHCRQNANKLLERLLETEGHLQVGNLMSLEIRADGGGVSV